MKAVLLYLALLASAAALFQLAPQLDLWVSALFYVPGRGFPLAGWPPLWWLHHAIGWLAVAIAVLLVGALLWLLLRKRPLWRLERREILFLALALALGPGLFANTLFKDHWGRARPTQIAAFGGAHQFTPALQPAGECAQNCSFVSGDAALGFSLLAFAFLLPAGPRRCWSLAAALAVGGLVGLARIVEGGHFLSDVVFAGFVVYGASAVLWWWILAPAAPRPHLFSWGAATAIAVIAAVAAVDRPLALAMHRHAAELRPLFDPIGRLGLAWGWLALFGLSAAALYWGGAWQRLLPHAAAMRALAAVPGFLFAAIAASGVTVDLLKLLFGRARPKLLFADGIYGFAWLSLDPRHWSFPSGHAATIAALMAGLWWLRPRWLWLYVAAAALVAGARVIAGEHYLGDVLGGAFIAVLAAWGVRRQFARWGIDPGAAGRIGPPLAPNAAGMVSPGPNGSLPRHFRQ